MLRIDLAPISQNSVMKGQNVQLKGEIFEMKSLSYGVRVKCLRQEVNILWLSQPEKTCYGMESHYSDIRSKVLDAKSQLWHEKSNEWDKKSMLWNVKSNSQTKCQHFVTRSLS